MNKFFKEGILIFISLIPLLFLLIFWNQFPAQVPTHFDISGNPNGFTEKNMLYLNPGLLCLGIYFLMLILPIIDPKKKIQEMGNKYYTLRLSFAIIFAVLSLHTLYSGIAGDIFGSSFTQMAIGVILLVLGNYFQTIRPNYFIGIRSPWTLESESVWKKTHALAGKLWMVGGLAIIALSLMLTNSDVLFAVFMSIIIFIALFPIVYSYSYLERKVQMARIDFYVRYVDNFLLRKKLKV